jgi:hypothetical protein
MLLQFIAHQVETPFFFNLTKTHQERVLGRSDSENQIHFGWVIDEIHWFIIRPNLLLQAFNPHVVSGLKVPPRPIFRTLLQNRLEVTGTLGDFSSNWTGYQMVLKFCSYPFPGLQGSGLNMESIRKFSGFLPQTVTTCNSS